jgi:hypothetical protein
MKVNSRTSGRRELNSSLEEEIKIREIFIVLKQMVVYHPS